MPCGSGARLQGLAVGLATGLGGRAQWWGLAAVLNGGATAVSAFLGRVIISL